jgi:hypothetical protein
VRARQPCFRRKYFSHASGIRFEPPLTVNFRGGRTQEPWELRNVKQAVSGIGTVAHYRAAQIQAASEDRCITAGRALKFPNLPAMRGLKPRFIFWRICGTAEAMPCYKAFRCIPIERALQKAESWKLAFTTVPRRGSCSRPASC